jgi:hypothetical protein
MSESYIKRTKRNKNFTTLGNSIFSAGLSAESLGVLCFILHLPDDWMLRKGHLQKHFKIGRDKMTRIFKELKAKGYLADLMYVKGEGGKFDGAHYIVYDEPPSDDIKTEKIITDKLETGSLKTRTPENQYTGNHTDTKDYINKELIIQNTNQQKQQSSAFKKYLEDDAPEGMYVVEFPDGSRKYYKDDDMSWLGLK